MSRLGFPGCLPARRHVRVVCRLSAAAAAAARPLIVDLQSRHGVVSAVAAVLAVASFSSRRSALVAVAVVAFPLAVLSHVRHPVANDEERSVRWMNWENKIALIF